MKKADLLLLFNCLILFFVFSCSQKQTNTHLSTTKNTDTIYRVTTKELKSNEIPDSVFRMTNLLTIDITGMDCDYGKNVNCFMIEQIPAKIKNLTALTSLNLPVNAIQSIPTEICKLKHLKSINLSDNPGLNTIDNIEQLKNLEYLYLYGCGLTKLPTNIGNLIKLKELGLTGNSIDGVEQARIKKALPNCEIKF